MTTLMSSLLPAAPSIPSRRGRQQDAKEVR